MVVCKHSDENSAFKYAHLCMMKRVVEASHMPSYSDKYSCHAFYLKKQVDIQSSKQWTGGRDWLHSCAHNNSLPALQTNDQGWFGYNHYQIK